MWETDAQFFLYPNFGIVRGTSGGLKIGSVGHAISMNISQPQFCHWVVFESAFERHVCSFFRAPNIISVFFRFPSSALNSNQLPSKYAGSLFSSPHHGTCLRIARSSRFLLLWSTGTQWCPIKQSLKGIFNPSHHQCRKQC